LIPRVKNNNKVKIHYILTILKYATTALSALHIERATVVMKHSIKAVDIIATLEEQP